MAYKYEGFWRAITVERDELRWRRHLHAPVRALCAS
jgi:hypothetical protein